MRASILPVVAVAILIVTSVVGGCAADDDGPATDRDRIPPTDARLNDIMQAKLVHSKALLEAIPIGDYDLVAENADELALLSEQSAWIVHDTASYRSLSDEFRGIARRMAERARARDYDGVSNANADMIASCTRCHQYLRREGLTRDMPGRVSMHLPMN